MRPAFRFVLPDSYRKDIESLRAIAVAGAILFHLGVLPRGYLGVDIFFVISGFLITGIIFRESQAQRYSLISFYIRRVRRILPLTLCVSLTALFLGAAVMLPDDLENLSQSVIATNICANNALQALTTRNYWDVVNEYKPLMHTWSLGVEEQYYFLYPFLFVPLQGRRVKYALPLISLLAAGSLALYLLEPAGYERFYFLQYRFFELAVGGITAILLNGRIVQHPFSLLPLSVMILLMVMPLVDVSDTMLVLTQVLATCGVLASANTNKSITGCLLGNPVLTYIGRISFSLYMWHQVVLAFSRYALWEDLSPLRSAVNIVVIVGLSVLTYHVIERPFRNAKAMSFRAVVAWLLPVFVVTMGAAGYIYSKAGVIRDVPALGIAASDAVRNMHGVYNDRVFQSDRPFEDQSDRIKVLVIGNSFARDWVNVLLESRFQAAIVISYVYLPELAAEIEYVASTKIRERVAQADIVFVLRATPELLADWSLGGANVWVVGPKNFGRNNGIYYNSLSGIRGGARCSIPEDVLQENEGLRHVFGSQFIDLISPLRDDANTVPVFTPEGRFISQDTRHLTRDGAKYYGDVLDAVLADVFSRR